MWRSFCFDCMDLQSNLCFDLWGIEDADDELQKKSKKIFLFISFVSTMLTVEVATDKQEGFIESKKNGNEKKKKAPAKSTGYKTSKVIEKAPSEDHPC